MANHKSAKTRITRNENRRVVNAARKSRARTFVKKVEAEILNGNKEEAKVALRVAESEMMKAAARGAIKKKAASRKISRLSLKIKNA